MDALDTELQDRVRRVLLEEVRAALPRYQEVLGEVGTVIAARNAVIKTDIIAGGDRILKTSTKCRRPCCTTPRSGACPRRAASFRPVAGRRPPGHGPSDRRRSRSDCPQRRATGHRSRNHEPAGKGDLGSPCRRPISGARSARWPAPWRHSSREWSAAARAGRQRPSRTRDKPAHKSRPRLVPARRAGRQLNCIVQRFTKAVKAA